MESFNPPSLAPWLKAACMALALACAPFAASAAPADNELGIDAPRIQQYMVGEFPRDFEALGGLLTLTARDPQVSIPATGQRVLVAFTASAASAGGQPTPVGRIHMSSGLRFDPQRGALFLDQPTLDKVQAASPGQEVDEKTRLLLNLWLADYAEKEALYELDAATSRSLGGIKVESTRIEGGRVIVRFDQPVALPEAGDALE